MELSHTPRGVAVVVVAGTVLVAVAALTALGCDAGSSDSGPDLGLQATIGLEFAQQRGCQGCHGSGSASDGVMSGRVMPLAGTSAYPANLTSDTATGLGGWADIEIVRAMRYGVDNQQQPLCPPMPHFDGSDPARPLMTDVEANAIVAYLRTLPPVVNNVPGSRCPPLKPAPPVDMAVPISDMTQVDHD